MILEAVSDESFNGVLIPLETRRHLEEENSNSTLILAAKRTRRKDPLDNLNRYTGGYNISNKHYWAVRSLSLSLGSSAHQQSLFGI